MYVLPITNQAKNNILTRLKKATKVGAIVGGQTSCKAPELAAFDKHLPQDVEILSCHSLHGPQVNPKGQPLVSPGLLFTANPISIQTSAINQGIVLRSSSNTAQATPVSNSSKKSCHASTRSTSTSAAKCTTASQQTHRPSRMPRS